MLGWIISIYRQIDDGTSPGTAKSPNGTCLAVWQTGLGGLDWVDELVKAGKAIFLAGNGGYPCVYTATAENLIPRIIDEAGPPHAREFWTYEVHDILMPWWAGKTVINHAAAATCRPHEWLLIEAWDES